MACAISKEKKQATVDCVNKDSSPWGAFNENETKYTNLLFGLFLQSNHRRCLQFPIIHDER